MAVSISFMLQKGGVGKSTLTGISAYLLSKRGERVLVVDMDSQGNVSTLLSHRDVYTFFNETLLEAIEDQDPESYIVSCGENLDLLPADDLLATFGQTIESMVREKRIDGPSLYVLKRVIGMVADRYDYILYDCPPSLNEQTLAALAASDYVVTVMQTEVYAFQALNRFFETLLNVKQRLNPELVMLGISAGLVDRYSLSASILDEAREVYGDVVFNTLIRRSARVAEFATLGISEARREQKQVLEQYEEVLDEILQRIEVGFSDNSIYLKALENRLVYLQEKLQQPLPDIKRERFKNVLDIYLEQYRSVKEWL